MPSHPDADDLTVTLQARLIADLEAQVAGLQDQVRYLEARCRSLEELVASRDQNIQALEERSQADQDLLGVYERSRAVRLASSLKRLQRDWRDDSRGGTETPR